MKHTVILCGSRLWQDEARVLDVLTYLRNCIVRHGAHWQGLDQIVKTLCHARGIETDPCPADWDNFGRAAGPRRNHYMAVKAPRAVQCVAFWHPGAHKGTDSMIQEAVAAGIHTTVIR